MSKCCASTGLLQPEHHSRWARQVCKAMSQVACRMQDHLRRASQVSSDLESRLRQEGRAEAQAHAQAQIQALKQGRAEAQAVALKQIQALLQERDDLQVCTASPQQPCRLDAARKSVSHMFACLHMSSCISVSLYGCSCIDVHTLLFIDSCHLHTHICA